MYAKTLNEFEESLLFLKYPNNAIARPIKINKDVQLEIKSQKLNICVVVLS
jgi:hypothetical protein